ncbi:DUF4296 domain-containing protein [Mucilaginibacter gotjawali]|uniref:Uncharacterized protein n=2 Tax=Mucilaginibacter gotjawali TaxID=1550579 RepID=A0A839SD22_9SPHI|nr:DUF4296 domain-containing protein [Mucilaginibacter gotjawali]MBB3055686.1 hypothetical protein [Mucilaginibacter gotjawali]BAU54505.1 hypothetical protein MgSA37_02681 [Mucilaginibacter gotjawali]
MHKYITLFFSVSLLLFACTAGKSNGKIIEHDQMVRLLTDIHILDGSLYNAVSQSPDTLYKYGTARYLTLFKKYHVDSIEFRRSLKYYTTQPIEFQAMYDKILVDLQAKTDSINKKLLKTTNAPHPK